MRNPEEPPNGEFGRRVFLSRMGLLGAGLVAASWAAACTPTKRRPAIPVPPSSEPLPPVPDNADADTALKALLEGNARYTGESSQHPNTGAERRAQLASNGQHPWATILGCADSRVPPEIIFDTGLGDLFSVRVAGEVATDTVVESLAYSVEHTGVNLILVLGHTGCGAVEAVLAGQTADIPDIAHYIEPAVEGIEDLGEAVVANALAQKELAIASGELRGIVGSGEVEVRTGVVDLATGEMRLVD